MESATSTSTATRKSNLAGKLLWAVDRDRRCVLPGGRRAPSGRAGQRDLGRHRRDRRVPDRAPLLWPLHRRQGARARSEPRDAGGAAQRRPRLRAHPQMGRVRTPLRRDRRRGPAGRPGARRTDGLPTGDAVDPGRRGVRGRRAGLHDPGSVAAPRRPLARADAARRAGRGPGRRSRWSECWC